MSLVQPADLKPILAEVHKRLQDAEDAHGASEVVRLKRWFLEEIPAQLTGQEGYGSPHPKMKPTVAYLSGLDERKWFDASEFETARALEQAYPDIRRELVEVMKDQDLEGELRNSYWNGFKLYDYTGYVSEANAKRCPRTWEVLNSIPRVHNARFSHLRPDAFIPPHCGSWNTVVLTHLGLIVPPEGCGIDVGGEIRGWAEGKCSVFGDFWEHSAWNRSDSERVVLILADWNPSLTAVEREFIESIRGHIAAATVLFGDEVADPREGWISVGTRGD